MKQLLLIPLFAITLVGCNQKAREFTTTLEDFSFSLEWGIQFDSSYNSATKELIKFKNVRERKVEEYTTSYQYPDLEGIYNKIKDMNLYSYPDKFDPFTSPNHIMSTPSTNYKLVIEDKSIEVNDFPIGINIEEAGLSKKGKKFIEIVTSITNTVTASDEWKTLPEPEYYYL